MLEGFFKNQNTHKNIVSNLNVIYNTIIKFSFVIRQSEMKIMHKAHAYLKLKVFNIKNIKQYKIKYT